MRTSFYFSASVLFCLQGLFSTVRAEEAPVSFRNQVQPILARYGCSTGACHGAAAGQNGFRLSLRGYDDIGDHLSITRHAGGRRIDLADPGRSLLLLKSTATLPHKGGKKFEVGSREYSALANWIAQGAPGPRQDEARIARLEMQPPRTTLSKDAAQPLKVLAHFSDGRSEDVTAWTKFASANESVCNVDDAGGVKVVGFGEGAVTAWYLQKVAVSEITVPFPNQLDPETFVNAARRNWIDDLVLEKLEALHLPPSPPCSDFEFLRRAFIDTIGLLPTADEARAYLADTNPDKRDQLVETLLRRLEFVDYWTYKWCDLLLVSSKKLKPAAMWSYYRWIREKVAANAPWDQFVREIVTANGSTLENGAANFYVLHEDPRLMAETTTQAFLGMSINCARCHNHPLEKWTNSQYFAFANLFSRVRTKVGPAGDGDHVIFTVAKGDLAQPLTGRPLPPAALDGKSMDASSSDDRRLAAVAWMASPDNAMFSRAIVNRVWANFLGVGLVEKVDDLRETNPASNEKLLNAAARFLAENKFDLKALMRAILQSATYQRSSQPLPQNREDSRFYSHYHPKRLMAEVMIDAFSQATGVPTEYKTDTRNSRGAAMAFPVGLRALQLPDSVIASYFLQSFGKPDREKTCECERTNEPSVAQVLHITNGDSLHKKLTASESHLTRVLAQGMTPEQIVEDAYLRCLGRLPTPAERARFVTELAGATAPEKRAVLEDAYWALLSSKEFLFNH
ncbi:MAG: DUF1549 and DUF1553 domain-containing protein [Verrucomicrobiales bacterium]